MKVNIKGLKYDEAALNRALEEMKALEKEKALKSFNIFDRMPEGMTVMLIFIWCIVLSAVTMLVLTVNGAETVKMTELLEKTEVQSFELNSEENAKFKIGYALESNYCLYVVDESKGKMINTYDVSETYVRDTLEVGEQAYVETSYTISYYRGSTMHGLFMGKDCVKYKGKKYMVIKKLKQHVIYVPKDYELVDTVAK